MLAYNAQQTTFWPSCQSGAASCMLGIRCTMYIMAVVANYFHAIVAIHTPAMIISSAMHAIKVYLPRVSP